MSRKLESGVIAAMSKAGAFRTDGYRLHEGFTGVYDVKNVTQYVSRGSENDDENAYRLSCSSETGNHSFNGFLMSNAYLVPKGANLDDVKTIKDDVKFIHYWEDIQDVARESRYLNTLMDEEEDFEFPEKFKIVGAVVSKDSKEDHPYIPLRRYPFYTSILRHHQQVADKDARFVDRDTIEMYLELPEKDRPKLPSNYKFKLHDHAKAVWKMENWNPTLLIEDWTEKDGD